MGGLAGRIPFAKINSAKIWSNLHKISIWPSHSRTDFRKNLYTLALCVYIHPKMSSKNRPFQLSSTIIQLSSTIGHIRICHALIMKLNEVILQSSVIILTLKDRQSMTMGFGPISQRNNFGELQTSSVSLNMNAFYSTSCNRLQGARKDPLFAQAPVKLVHH